MTVDAMVIGGGVSGLTCARALSRAGFETVVLEARDRVGGRVRTLRAPGEEPLEVGAQVVHGHDSVTRRLLDAEGLAVASAELPSRFVLGVDGQAVSVADLVAQGARPPWLLEQCLRDADHDDRPVADVLGATARSALELETACEWIVHRWSGHPADLSAAGVWRTLASRGDDQRQYVPVLGYDQLPVALSGGLDVRLGSPVTEVSWTRGAVEARIADGRVTARAAVVTVPPTVVASGGIRFTPDLPQDKMSAADDIDLGDALVVVAHAEPAPWSGVALTVGRSAGLWRSRRGSRRVTGWFRGAAACRMRARALDAPFVSGLVEPFFPWVTPTGIDQLGTIDWGADPFTLGGFSYPRVGKLEAPKVWATPVADTIFFAGEATSGVGNAGLVDGAVESGHRAAGEVVRARGPRAGHETRPWHEGAPEGAR